MLYAEYYRGNCFYRIPVGSPDAIMHNRAIVEAMLGRRPFTSFESDGSVHTNFRSTYNVDV